MFFIVIFFLFHVFYVLTPLGPLLSRNHTEGRGGEAPNSSSFIRRGRGLVVGLGAHGRRLACSIWSLVGQLSEGGGGASTVGVGVGAAADPSPSEGDGSHGDTWEQHPGQTHSYIPSV